MLDVSSATRTMSTILDQMREYYVGDMLLLRKLLAATLSNGHILLEDNPGLGKTLLVKLFASSIGATFTRIQLTPDMLPADIIGTRIWQPGQSTFETMRGPVFTQILLADELNRATPKTQSALLEAMEEKQVTIEGETLQLPRPFLVLATQNPIEFEGTYPLPEAQLDRFSILLSMGYPTSLSEETTILTRRMDWKTNDPSATVKPIVDSSTFREIQALVESSIYVDQAILDYIAGIVRQTRQHPRVEIGASPRGGLALLALSKAFALLEGQDFVTPDHVKILAVNVLAHRLVLKIEAALENYPTTAVISEVVEQVEIPTDFRREGP